MARFVLVHGGFSGAWIWLPLMDRLKAAGHSVEAFDLPGMGDDHTSASDSPVDAACIHGDVYGTVSASTVIVGANRITYEHAPGRPCVTPFATVEAPS